MKYYGFNPFINAHQNGKEGVIYDLIKGVFIKFLRRQ